MKLSMKKLFLVAIGASAVFLTGCLKGNPPVDFSSLGTIMQIEDPVAAQFGGIGSGLQYFQATQLLYSALDAADSNLVMNNIDAPSPLGISLGTTATPDPTAINDNYSNDSVTYVMMPDSDFSIENPTGVIPAGTLIDTFMVYFYPGKFDQTQNQMLPITVVTNPVEPVSANFGHIYFHNIGIAGSYAVTGFRYTYTGSSGWTGSGPYPTPTSTTNLATVVDSVTAPVLATAPLVITLPYADLGTSMGYDLWVTYIAPAGAGIVGNAALSVATNFTIYTNTLIFEGKAVIHVVSLYTDAGGNDNIVDETYTQH
jgi:hypothetical protein